MIRRAAGSLSLLFLFLVVASCAPGESGWQPQRPDRAVLITEGGSMELSEDTAVRIWMRLLEDGAPDSKKKASFEKGAFHVVLYKGDAPVCALYPAEGGEVAIDKKGCVMDRELCRYLKRLCRDYTEFADTYRPPEF